MPIDTAQIRNMGQTAIASRAQGQQNRLLAEAAARDEQFRNLIAESIGPQAAGMVQTGGDNLLVPGSSPAPPQLSADVMNGLMAIDPERATQLVQAQQQQQAFRRQEEQAKASEVVQRMQFVLGSETPAQSLKLAGRMGGNDLVDVLAEQGIIDSSDGISDEEARIVAQATIEAFSPMLPPEELPRASGLEGTFQALERRGVNVTPEMALQLAQASDSEIAALAAQLGVQKSILDLERTRFDLMQRQAEAERTGQDQEAQKAKKQTQALGSAERVVTAWDALDKIGQSAVARPGFAGRARSSVASALALVGMEDPEVAAAAEQFQDVATISGAELIKDLGLDPTDTKFRAITQATLSLDKGDETNRRQLQRFADTVIGEIDSGRLQAPPSLREKMQDISDWSPTPQEPLIDLPEAAGAAAASVAEIGRMGMREIQSLASDLDDMTQEQIDAVARRLDELGL